MMATLKKRYNAKNNGKTWQHEILMETKSGKWAKLNSNTTET